jgi:membrane peptidoglycan carboxypeptidase
VKDLSGVKIFTTFDSVAQDAAEKAAVEGIPALKKQRKLSDLETAMVVVDRNTGEVRAMVGGASRSLRAITVPCRRVVRLVLWQNRRPISPR